MSASPIIGANYYCSLANPDQEDSSIVSTSDISLNISRSTGVNSIDSTYSERRDDIIRTDQYRP